MYLNCLKVKSHIMNQKNKIIVVLLFEVLESSSIVKFASHIQRIRLSVNQGERVHLKESEVQI